MPKYNIKMIEVKPEITQHGFNLEGTNEFGDWYSIVIPQTFRGKYQLLINNDNIYGMYYGCSSYDYDFDRFMDKLGFRTPEAVEWTINLLNDLKSKGIIDFEEEQKKSTDTAVSAL